MGVVVRRCIDILIIIITIPYSTCISSIFGSNIPTSLFILKMFFHSLHKFTCREVCLVMIDLHALNATYILWRKASYFIVRYGTYDLCLLHSSSVYNCAE